MFSMCAYIIRQLEIITDLLMISLLFIVNEVLFDKIDTYYAKLDAHNRADGHCIQKLFFCNFTKLIAYHFKKKQRSIVIYTLSMPFLLLLGIRLM